MKDGTSARPDGARNRAIRHALNRWFPDRQFLVRGADRLSAVTLTQRQQVFAAATAVIILASAAACGLTAAWTTLGAAKNSAAARHLASALAMDQAALHRAAAQNAALLAQRDQAVAQVDRIRDQAVAAAVAKLTRLHDQTAAQADLARDEAAAQQALIAAANDATLAQLQARTQGTIDQVEGIIKSTGLDPDHLAGPASPAGGKPDGGIDWSGITPAEQNHDDLLLNDVARLQALGAVLGQMPLASPVAFISVTSPFGYRPDPWTGAREFHVGVDLRGPVGTPIYATAPGTVTYAGGETGYGLIVIIDHGYGFTTRYSHLHRIEVTLGEKIGLHQQIALLGNTGWSTGPHLLYETRVDGQPQNPMQFMKEADVQK